MNKRMIAFKEVLNRKPVSSQQSKKQISEYFAENVFTLDKMRKYLSEETFEKVKESIEKGVPIDRKIAAEVAEAMKSWAMSKGVTHYTHWFQPLNGETAEKHDAFMEWTGDGRIIEKFSGNQLAQQEPDASSFPSGGIRNTFEARGYTAWDPTSPAFIIDRTLCIPSVFVSYTGETLDYKTPLLRSIHALDKAATEVCQYFDKNVTKVYSTLGWEQEYFLIDAAYYNARYDIQQTGRTLFGHAPAKGQQLEDHYWGSIPERVSEFMKDFEYECHLLGIPVKTRHNEVAPAQFECAPIFEEVSVAVDHNVQLMDIMEKVAIRHGFRVLFHEKPFAGVNGSGKHNNWSMATNTGKNLLAPGKTPRTNLQFLTFFVNVIKAVHDYADLLRASIATASNDHRLGANEAPPAIMSVFIGKYLSDLLDELEKNVPSTNKMSPEEKTALKLGIGKIPEILLDNTDRNRTSPFAFTGNKFEFRAVGSSANCGNAMMVLNLIVAKTLTEFKKEVDALIEKGKDKDEAIFQIIKKYITASKKIRFEGNGYSEEWKKEAGKRGLNNFTTTPEALKIYHDKKIIQLFEEMNILTEREIKARHEIQLETYIKKVQIESRVMAEMIHHTIIPAALAYQHKLVETVKGLKEIYSTTFVGTSSGEDTETPVTPHLEIIKEISERVNILRKAAIDMTEDRKKANAIEDVEKRAFAYCEKIKPYFETIRYHADKLELIVADEYWPLPKYAEMLNLR
ncbi:MAG: glutamine synthetase [Bacteroidia bacterium]|nr:MAG: glutamine synthetase [Bacteroidia bacterium]